MEKYFDKWNERKKNIDSLKVRKIFSEQEIWWCSLGINIANEQNGKGKNFQRPVLIVRKYNNYQMLALPLSTVSKESKYYYEFNFKGKKQSALLSQIKVISVNRLTDKMGKISDKLFKEIKQKIYKTNLE